MNHRVKWLPIIAATLATFVISSQSVFARGGAANIMNSPGYQRRLQESRQQPSQVELQAAIVHRKTRYHHRH
jgi:hypothetical protein